MPKFIQKQFEPRTPAPNTVLVVFTQPEDARQALDKATIRLSLDEPSVPADEPVGGPQEETNRGVHNVDHNEDMKKQSNNRGPGPDAKAEPAKPRNDGVEREANVIYSFVERLINQQPESRISSDLDFDDDATTLLPTATKWGKTFSAARRTPSPPPSPPLPPITSSPPTPFPSQPNPPHPNFSQSYPFQANYPESPPAPSPKQQPPSPPPSSPNPPPQLNLHISPSALDHAAYIARQGYWGTFRPDTKSVMAGDLKGRVPLFSHVDVKLGKGERELRVRRRRKRGEGGEVE
ncbi:hypothetical protein MMC20_005257 [Loxospora ochrophaea]|nr:hypothetical protein [Loxospora ochrophaea]